MGVASLAWKEKGAATDGRRPPSARKRARSPGHMSQDWCPLWTVQSEGVIRLWQGNPERDQRLDCRDIVSRWAFEKVL